MSYVSGGSMRNRIAIEQFKSSSDGQGGQTAGAWQVYARAFASIEPMLGQSRLMAMNAGTENPVKICMRYTRDRAAITPKMRVKFGTRIFSIVQRINVEEGNETIELECAEVTG